MAAFPTQSPPWPAPTAPPPPLHPQVPQLAWAGASAAPPPHRRQAANQTQIGQAEQACWGAPNAVFSCWPESGVQVPQHQYVTFVWNSQQPEFVQTNRVNIYLFAADSGALISEWADFANPTNRAGALAWPVNDSWWPGARGATWNGSDVLFPFYFAVIRSDATLQQSEVPQSTFYAVQTTYADSVLASMSSTSAAAAASSSASRASASSASAAAAASSSASRSGLGSGAGSADPSATAPGGNGSLQPGAGAGSAFPHWAIAVIVVLGFLALLAACGAAFLALRRLRARRSPAPSNRGSLSSAEPMMAHAGGGGGGAQAPLLGAAGAGAAPERAPSVVQADGASTGSRAHSLGGDAGGPFSGADAAIMADAFRKALRKPDFAAVEEGESPDGAGAGAGAGGEGGGEGEGALMSRELAEEGRDIRSVGSSRGVRVETLSDAGDDAGGVRDPPR